jgi:hypothetical protein
MATMVMPNAGGRVAVISVNGSIRGHIFTGSAISRAR